MLALAGSCSGCGCGWFLDMAHHFFDIVVVDADGEIEDYVILEVLEVGEVGAHGICFGTGIGVGSRVDGDGCDLFASSATGLC